MNNLFAYDFMRNAFMAGTIAALSASIIGYFVVIRQSAFTGHALSHVGFAGAAGAGLIGLSPINGQLLFTLLTAVGMGGLGERIQKNDIAVGVMLAFAMSLGILFLHFYTSYAGQATAILFGDLLSVSQKLIKLMFIFALTSIIGLAIISRPLLFSSLEPELAEAKGISLRLISILFLIIVAIGITQASQVVGILLVFTLLIGPGAAALNLTRTIFSGVLLSALFGLVITWAGIVLSYITDWPNTFWISALSLFIYLISLTKLTRPIL